MFVPLYSIYLKVRVLVFWHTLKPQKFIHSSTTLKHTTHPQTAKPHLFAKTLKPIALCQTPFVHHKLKAHHTHPNPKTPFVHQNPKSQLRAKLQNPTVHVQNLALQTMALT